MHGTLRREQVSRAIVNGAELDALVLQHARAGQAEDLESAGVGEDGPVPAHETVQAAVRGHDVRARPEEQVIGVGQQHVGAELAQRARRHRLDGRLCADRHETRRRHVAVRSVQCAGPGTSVAGLYGEQEVRVRLRVRSAHRTSMASPKL